MYNAGAQQWPGLGSWGAPLTLKPGNLEPNPDHDMTPQQDPLKPGNLEPGNLEHNPEHDTKAAPLTLKPGTLEIWNLTLNITPRQPWPWNPEIWNKYDTIASREPESRFKLILKYQTSKLNLALC